MIAARTRRALEASLMADFLAGHRPSLSLHSRAAPSSRSARVACPASCPPPLMSGQANSSNAAGQADKSDMGDWLLDLARRHGEAISTIFAQCAIGAAVVLLIAIATRAALHWAPWVFGL